MAVKGYKVFNSDWTCRGKQYSCPGMFTEDVNLEVCEKGMHFCEKLIDCFTYYGYDKSNRVAEVIAHGKIKKKRDKSCTDKLEIVRELSWAEVLELVNVGHYNSGFNNTGSFNSGHGNSGWENEGNCNAGHQNTGNCNVGNQNQGNYNTGNNNIGSLNTGSFNIGIRNVGDFNTGNGFTGCFNTKAVIPKIYMFNKPSDWTYQDYCFSNAQSILRRLKETERYKTPQDWWNDLTDIEKKEIFDLPNFDPEIFKECVGVDTID